MIWLDAENRHVLNVRTPEEERVEIVHSPDTIAVTKRFSFVLKPTIEFVGPTLTRFIGIEAHCARIRVT